MKGREMESCKNSGENETAKEERMSDPQRNSQWD
jgi:hypothetical protein